MRKVFFLDAMQNFKMVKTIQMMKSTISTPHRKLAMVIILLIAILSIFSFPSLSQCPYPPLTFNKAVSKVAGSEAPLSISGENKICVFWEAAKSIEFQLEATPNGVPLEWELNGITIVTQYSSSSLGQVILSGNTLIHNYPNSNLTNGISFAPAPRNYNLKVRYSGQIGCAQLECNYTPISTYATEGDGDLILTTTPGALENGAMRATTNPIKGFNFGPGATYFWKFDLCKIPGNQSTETTANVLVPANFNWAQSFNGQLIVKGSLQVYNSPCPDNTIYKVYMKKDPNSL